MFTWNGVSVTAHSRVSFDCQHSLYSHRSCLDSYVCKSKLHAIRVTNTKYVIMTRLIL